MAPLFILVSLNKNFTFFVVEPDITDEKAEEIADSPNPQDYVKNIMMGRSEEIEDRVAEIEERHEGIMRIEQGVKEIQVG